MQVINNLNATMMLTDTQTTTSSEKWKSKDPKVLKQGDFLILEIPIAPLTHQ